MVHSHLTKEEIIDGIKNNKINFKSLPYSFKTNKEILIEEVKQHGLALCETSEILKNNREVVLEAVKQNGSALGFVSEILKDDKAVVLEAVKQNGWTLKYASERLQNDKELLQLLQKEDISYWSTDDKKWFNVRMDILADITEKEFMENSNVHSDKSSKKLKF